MNFRENSELLKRNYKLIALDIDGTLITSDHILTSRTIKAINDIKKAGIKVTVATGRHYNSAKTIARKIGINAPLVSKDGALIKNIYTKKTLFTPLSMNIAQDILNLTEEYRDLRVDIFMEDKIIFAGKSYRKLLIRRFLRFPPGYSVRGTYNILRDFVFIPVTNTNNIQGAIKAMDDSPAKVVVYGEAEELNDFIKTISQKYNEDISMTTAIVNCVDILQGGVSKAKGLALLSEKLGITRDEIIAVGDNINDIEMLEYAGLGVAMGNALEEVKEKADIVTKSNDEDGLAYFLETLLSRTS